MAKRKNGDNLSDIDTETLMQAYAGQRNPRNLANRHEAGGRLAGEELRRRGVNLTGVTSTNTGGKVKRGGGILRSIGKAIGTVGSIAAPLLAATGVGLPLAAGIGAGSGLLRGKGLGGAALGAGSALLGAGAGKLIRGAGGIGGIIEKAKTGLGGLRGLAGTVSGGAGKKSLLPGLLGGVTGIMGTISSARAGRARDRLLEEQTGVARGIASSAAPLRNAGSSALLASLLQGARPGPDLSTLPSTGNPFRRPVSAPPAGASASAGGAAPVGMMESLRPRRKRLPQMAAAY